MEYSPLEQIRKRFPGMLKNKLYYQQELVRLIDEYCRFTGLPVREAEAELEALARVEILEEERAAALAEES